MSAESVKKNEASGLGLDSIGDLSGLLDDPSVSAVEAANQGPMEIPIDLIDEDPEQPRKEDNPGFSKESLEELAVTIRRRGVKSPISVRDNLDVPGRFIINHGARRYRSSIIAEKQTIPGFVDNDYQEEDQVIENLQRDALTPREIADYIGRKLAAGIKKKDIAELIGKSPAYVTQHVTLLDLPDVIAEAFNLGRASDVTVVNELVRVHKKNPDEVEAWLDDEDQELTRGSVKLLREYLEDKRRHSEDDDRDPNTIDAFTGKTDAERDEEESSQTTKAEKKEPDPDKLKSAIVLVLHDDRQARLVLKRRPSAEGWAWIKYDDDGHEVECDLNEVRLVALLEG
ncbi:ParB/RepB/Spo0J family partition protein [Hahella ganghwensis]|uniref:ParB/RepB/Spo0J family partition protein n=1 Tax=Hahella ganghwensis TaxID=286420 RepID=UPI0003744CFE|nr:ParB/RepB/Spo0J family partition protein [Hahella ganghwensis]